MVAALDAGLAERFIGGRRGSSPERALWCAVLGQAIDDLDRGDLPTSYLSSADFKAVIDLAGLDPAAVRQRLMSRVRERMAA